MIRSWLRENKTQDWVQGMSITSVKYLFQTKSFKGLNFVQMQKNSSHHRIIQRSPFQALFGKAPKIGAEALNLPPELLSRISNEEDLQPYLAETTEPSNSSGVDEIPTDEVRT